MCWWIGNNSWLNQELDHKNSGHSGIFYRNQVILQRWFIRSSFFRGSSDVVSQSSPSTSSFISLNILWESSFFRHQMLRYDFAVICLLCSLCFEVQLGGQFMKQCFSYTDIRIKFWNVDGIVRRRTSLALLESKRKRLVVGVSTEISGFYYILNMFDVKVDSQKFSGFCWW